MAKPRPLPQNQLGFFDFEAFTAPALEPSPDDADANLAVAQAPETAPAPVPAVPAELEDPSISADATVGRAVNSDEPVTVDAPGERPADAAHDEPATSDLANATAAEIPVGLRRALDIADESIAADSVERDRVARSTPSIASPVPTTKPVRRDKPMEKARDKAPRIAPMSPQPFAVDSRPKKKKKDPERTLSGTGPAPAKAVPQLWDLLDGEWGRGVRAQFEPSSKKENKERREARYHELFATFRRLPPDARGLDETGTTVIHNELSPEAYRLALEVVALAWPGALKKIEYGLTKKDPEARASSIGFVALAMWEAVQSYDPAFVGEKSQKTTQPWNYLLNAADHAVLQLAPQTNSVKVSRLTENAAKDYIEAKTHLEAMKGRGEIARVDDTAILAQMNQIRQRKNAAVARTGGPKTSPQPAAEMTSADDADEPTKGRYLTIADVRKAEMAALAISGASRLDRQVGDNADAPSKKDLLPSDTPWADSSLMTEDTVTAKKRALVRAPDPNAMTNLTLSHLGFPRSAMALGSGATDEQVKKMTGDDLNPAPLRRFQVRPTTWQGEALKLTETTGDGTRGFQDRLLERADAFLDTAARTQLLSAAPHR